MSPREDQVPGEAAPAAGAGARTPDDLAGALEAVRRAEGARARAVDRLDAAALAARALGASWSAIGAAAGLTSEGARKRYGDHGGPPPAAL